MAVEAVAVVVGVVSAILPIPNLSEDARQLNLGVVPMDLPPEVTLVEATARAIEIFAWRQRMVVVRMVLHQKPMKLVQIVLRVEAVLSWVVVLALDLDAVLARILLGLTKLEVIARVAEISEVVRALNLDVVLMELLLV